MLSLSKLSIGAFSQILVLRLCSSQTCIDNNILPNLKTKPNRSASCEQQLKQISATMPTYTQQQREIKSWLTLKAKKNDRKAEKITEPISITSSLLTESHNTDINPKVSHSFELESVTSNFLKLIEDSKIDIEAAYSQSSAELEMLRYDKVLKKGSQIVSKYGSEDPNLDVTRQPCYGCGALLQANNIRFPGFVPAEVLGDIIDDYDALRDTQCLRCDLMKKHKLTLDVAVDESQIYDVFRAIREDRNPLVLHIVDITRVPQSIVPNLTELIGADTKVVLIANKVDLVPPDSVSFERRWKSHLSQLCAQKGLTSDNIVSIFFVSAKTGYNMESLVSFLCDREHNRTGTVYIVGHTNVGKSHLFNSLLDSDFCKVHIREFYHKATVSPFPGTTLNTLKFPVLTLSDDEMVRRCKRLRDEKILSDSKMLLKEKIEQKKSKILSSPVHLTFDASEYLKPEVQQDLVEAPAYKFDKKSKATLVSVPDEKSVLKVQNKFLRWPEIDERQFNKWCVDTPGITKVYDIEKYMNDNEWNIAMASNNVWKPRTYVMRKGLSLLIAGLARLDVLDVDGPSIYATCQSPFKNIHLVDTHKVDSYIEQYSNFLYQKGERPHPLPNFVLSEYRVQPYSENLSSYVDFVFGCLGWVAITSCVPVVIAAGMPGSCDDLVLREPSFFNLAVRLKGARFTTTKEFYPNIDMK